MPISIYNSHTHGPIPLSLTGKALLQKLREAIGETLNAGEWITEVSHARGELAKYISSLEAKQQPHIKWPPLDLYEWAAPKVMGSAISGGRANLVVMDDISNKLKESIDMVKKKAVAKRKAEAKFRNVGVRFLNSGNIGKVYQYKVRKAAKVHLGQELVVTNDSGISVVIVVSIDAPLTNDYVLDGLKEITSKVAAL